MSKKVFVIEGSPRRNGNTAILSDEFIRGAKESGNETEKIYIQEKNVKGCLGCCACQRNGGSCVQKDDMQEIYEKLKAADVIIFASPVYFYTWTSQIKAVIDRTFAVEQALAGKTFYLITAGAATEEKYMEVMLESFRKYIGCFRGEGNKEGGYVFGLGTNAPGDVTGTPALDRAFQMGKQI